MGGAARGWAWKVLKGRGILNGRGYNKGSKGVSFKLASTDLITQRPVLLDVDRSGVRIAMTDSQTSHCDEDNRRDSADNGQQQPAAAVSISLGDSPPRGSALLLCPAQWSALLEAAPVSLVVREMRDGTTVAEDPEQPDFGGEAESEAEEKEGEKIPRLVFAEDDEIRTPLGGQTPDPDRYNMLHNYCTFRDYREVCVDWKDVLTHRSMCLAHVM